VPRLNISSGDVYNISGAGKFFVRFEKIVQEISIQIENYMYVSVKAWGGVTGINPRTQYNNLSYNITHETSNYDTAQHDLEVVHPVCRIYFGISA
jgi:hypothetical protein